MAGGKSSSHSSSSKSSTSAIDDKNLLLFYQKKFEEHQRKEDKYKEKIDKHLKNLVTDRHELEEELLRRGEKISDLQKALVELQLSVFEERERFLKVSAENDELKRNEELLHTNIRELLSMTHQKDLRDKIIYILKDPKVEIGYRTGFPTKSESSSSETLANKKLKKELEYLQNQLDEVLKISRNKSDVVLEDCKQALEKSKEKIMQDEIQIRELQKKLQEINVKKSSSLKTLPTESQLVKQASSADTFSNICSQLKAIHLSLILLLKVISKITNILINIQATKLYHRLANIPNTPTDMQHIVEENSILQLESCLRQCTRLTYDINDMHKSLIKYISNNGKSIQNVNVLRSEFKHFEEMLKEMTILTADNELLNVGLNRTSFFYALRDSSVRIQEEDRMQHLNDFKKIISNCDILHKTVSRAADFLESVVKKYSSMRDHWSRFADLPQEFSSTSLDSPKESRFADLPQKFSSTSLDSPKERPNIRKTAKSDSELISLRQAKSDTLKDLEKLLGIYKRTVQEAENLGFGQSTEAKLLAEKLKATQKKLEEEEMLENGNVKKKLMRSEEQQTENGNVKKRLMRSEQQQTENDNVKKKLMRSEEQQTENDNIKKKLMRSEEQQTYLKGSDYEETLRKINKTLSKVKMVEQGEYLMDEKLCEKLAENVNDLTKKFKELSDEFNVKTVQDQLSEYSRVTLSKLEELAKQSRNSVIAAESQIAAHRSNAKHLSQKLKETEELLRESINECLSLKQKVKQAEEQHEKDKYTFISGLREKLDKVTSTTELDGVVDELVTYITDNKGTQSDPFVCVYCQQGMGHKLCQEKINRLRDEERKFQTQLKILQGEAKQEKATFMHYRDIAEKAAADLGSTNEALKETVKTLESRNASLLERLKLEKNRIKNMERFRRLEIEGFQTDIRNLKSKIRDLEKQLLKAVLLFENNNKDMELLQTVHETAYRSKQATAALRRLKAKLYELENDIKSL